MTLSYCQGCQKEHKDYSWHYKIKEGWFCTSFYKPKPLPEFIPNRIKEDRAKHAKDIIQPHRKGEPSKEFITQYPEKAKTIFTPKEITKAKNVWSDLKGH